MNRSINSATGLEWPQEVANTPNNVALAEAIIGDCRVTPEGVTLTLISAEPERFLGHMHKIFVYLEAFNND